jgi:aminoglycoside phosphotransferase (APT) family kinase protein
MALNPRDLFPSDRLGEIIDIQPFASGMSKAVVRAVKTASGTYVLRVHPDRDGAEGETDTPFDVLRLVAENGIAPPLLHADEANRCTVWALIDAAPLATALASPQTREAAFTSLVRQLARLHALPPPGGVVSRDLLETARALWSGQSQRPGFAEWARPLGARLPELGAVLARDPRTVLSHCDMNPTNILWDGTRVWMVDWDQAALMHPYLDLAVIANFLNLGDGETVSLVAAQEGAPLSPEQREVLSALRDVTRLIFGCLFVGLVPDLTALPWRTADEVPTLGECYARMRAGTLDVRSVEGQAMMGHAVFKQALGA